MLSGPSQAVQSLRAKRTWQQYCTRLLHLHKKGHSASMAVPSTVDHCVPPYYIAPVVLVTEL